MGHPCIARVEGWSRRAEEKTYTFPDGGNFDGWPTTWEEQGRAGRATFSGAERRGDGSWSDRVRYLDGRFGEFCGFNLSYKLMLSTYRGKRHVSDSIGLTLIWDIPPSCQPELGRG